MPTLYTKSSSRRYKSLPTSWWSASDDELRKNLGDELTPNLPLIDVVQDFPWTLTPTRSEARKEAPFIYLREWLQLDTQLNQCLLPYGKDRVGSLNFPTGQNFFNDVFKSVVTVIGGLANILDFVNLEDSDNLYKGLFDHLTPTDFIYKLPFFTEEYFSIQNNWAGIDVIDKILELQTKGLGLGRGIFRLLNNSAPPSQPGQPGQPEQEDKLLKLPYLLRRLEMFNLESKSPAVGLMDPPHIWKSTNNRQYSFSFPLYNIDATNDSKSESLILKNWEFCYLLTYQNLINKGNFYTAIPPVFYEVTIPGIHYCKASYMSNISIENIGNIRLMQLPINGDTKVDVNVPDGYLITITMNDLLMPSKNLLHAAVNTETRQKIQQGII